MHPNIRDFLRAYAAQRRISWEIKSRRITIVSVVDYALIVGALAAWIAIRIWMQ